MEVGDISKYVFNRKITKDFFTTPNQTECWLFANATDGVIIPEGDVGDFKAKLFTVDKNWKRIIYSDKNFVGIPGVQLFRDYNGSNGNYQLMEPTGVTYGMKFPATNQYPFYIADYGANMIKTTFYQVNNITNPINTMYHLKDVDGPYDLAYHYGAIQINYDYDDLLWFTQIGNMKSLNCIYARTGNNIGLPITSFIWQNQIYQFRPTKIDVSADYYSSNPDYHRF